MYSSLLYENLQTNCLRPSIKIVRNSEMSVGIDAHNCFLSCDFFIFSIIARRIWRLLKPLRKLH